MSPYFKTETKARELCRLSSSYKSRPRFRQTARVFERIKSPEAHRRCFPLRSRFLKTIIKENVRVDLIITYSKPSPTLIAGLQISKAVSSTALLRACAPRAPSLRPTSSERCTPRAPSAVLTFQILFLASIEISPVKDGNLKGCFISMCHPGQRIEYFISSSIS